MHFVYFAPFHKIAGKLACSKSNEDYFCPPKFYRGLNITIGPIFKIKLLDHPSFLAIQVVRVPRPLSLSFMIQCPNRRTVLQRVRWSQRNYVYIC